MIPGAELSFDLGRGDGTEHRVKLDASRSQEGFSVTMTSIAYGGGSTAVITGLGEAKLRRLGQLFTMMADLLAEP